MVKNLPDTQLPGKYLSFEPVDLDKNSGLRLGYLALTKGDQGARVLYKADEIAVDKFLKGEIKFTQIVPMIEKELKKI